MRLGMQKRSDEAPDIGYGIIVILAASFTMYKVHDEVSMELFNRASAYGGRCTKEDFKVLEDTSSVAYYALYDFDDEASWTDGYAAFQQVLMDASEFVRGWLVKGWEGKIKDQTVWSETLERWKNTEEGPPSMYSSCKIPLKLGRR